MDNIALTSRNRSQMSMSMSMSKIAGRQSFLTFSQPTYEGILSHLNCSCFHCQNNTKPLETEFYPRIKAQDQYTIENNQAYSYLVSKMIDYVGTVKIPDVFVSQNSSLIYYSNTKLKIKEKAILSLSQIKKIFDLKRGQYKKITRNQSVRENAIEANKTNRNSSNLSVSTQQRKQRSASFMLDSNRKDKQMKQIAVINYKESFNQILTQTCLSKYLDKRKNDPFWQQISTISLIPPYKQKQITYHMFKYERTQKNTQQMQIIMQRVAKCVDYEDQSNGQTVSSNSLNPQVQAGLKKLLQITVRSNSTIKADKQMSGWDLGKTIEKINLIENQMTQNISKEIVAYLQIKFHVRILACTFKFMIDYENNYYFTNVENFIAVNLKKRQLRSVHDRLTNLEQAENGTISELKITHQEQQSLNLRNVLVDLVADCLLKRKLQLKHIQYKKPSDQNLVNIFKKVFPTFEQEQFFTNPNWKNQFKVYLSDCRNRINKIIRQDQGIRILKRFGITFYRTWD